MRSSTMEKRMGELCSTLSSWSKDRSRKTAAVIVDCYGYVVMSMGWNGFPRDIDDDVEERHERPAKYKWTEHAERNAIYNAARKGIALEGCAMYMPWYPCADCARGIIQSGIDTVYCVEPDWDDPHWGADFRIVEEMFNEAAINVNFIGGNPPELEDSESV